MTKAIRWNRGKTRLSLVCPHFAEDLARQLGIGEDRYGPGNWKKGLPISEVLDSMKRHTAALERGEEIDPDTGLHHTAAIASNAMFLHHYHRTGQQEELDDRHHKRRLDQVPPMRDEAAEGELRTEPPGQERLSVQQVQEPGEEPTEEISQRLIDFERIQGVRVGALQSDIHDLLSDLGDFEFEDVPVDPVQHLQDRIKRWADDVFPDRTAHGALSKLILEEIPELLNGGLDDPLEYADVLILILDVASLRGIDAIAAAHEKMTINESRSWEVDRSTGLMHHVEEDPLEEPYYIVRSSRINDAEVWQVLDPLQDPMKVITETRRVDLAIWIRNRLNTGWTWPELQQSAELVEAMTGDWG